jgi:hypothetical protein
MKIQSAFAITLIILGPYQVFAEGTSNQRFTQQEPKVREINESPSRWWGKKVSLHGEVEKIYSRGAFVLEGNGVFNNQILVIPKISMPSHGQEQNQAAGTAAGLKLKKDDEVHLTGVVQQLTKENITKIYGRDLDPELKVEIKGSMPVVIAQTINTQTSSK